MCFLGLIMALDTSAFAKIQLHPCTIYYLGITVNVVHCVPELDRWKTPYRTYLIPEIRSS